MPTDILDRLQEDKVQGLEELVNAWRSAPAEDNGEDQAAAVADFFVDEGIGLRQGLLRHWDYYWTLALAGKILDRSVRLAQLRGLLERGGRLLAQTAVAARSYAERSGHEVARLAQFEEQVKAFPLWVEECVARWELLDRPHKPLNRERIARAQAAFAQGECEPVSDILTRVTEGGPLVKE
jgi:hypothetical protein